MNRSRLVPGIGLLALALSPVLATACVPSWMLSSAPAIIRLVGSAGGVADTPAGSFTVVVRDLANNPVPGASVVLDLSGCPDATICPDQLDANEVVNMTAKTVRKFADTNGQAAFTIVGGSTGNGNAVVVSFGQVIKQPGWGPGNGAVRIYGNGTLLGAPSFATYDLDGSGGVGPADLSVFLTDIASGTPFARSDFSGDGVLNSTDLCLWLTAFAAGRSVQSCSVHP